MKSTALVPGSLQAIAQQQGQTLAESFLSADAIVLVDVSGSMGATLDGGPGAERASRTRYQAACDELKALQARMPGKIAVVAFSSKPAFAPGGVPLYDAGGTDMAKALQFVHCADDCGISFVLISDGAPNDEIATLAEARKFKSSISTIFIGHEGEAGADFLRRLAAASGGQFERNSAAQLAASVQRLLLTAG